MDVNYEILVAKKGKKNNEMFAFGEILSRDLQRKHKKLIQKQQIVSGFNPKFSKNLMK